MNYHRFCIVADIKTAFLATKFCKYFWTNSNKIIVQVMAMFFLRIFSVISIIFGCEFLPSFVEIIVFFSTFCHVIYLVPYLFISSLVFNSRICYPFLKKIVSLYNDVFDFICNSACRFKRLSCLRTIFRRKFVFSKFQKLS